jgi:hypothetical protein
MYAIIEDDHDLTRREKPVLSVHKSREDAEKAIKEHWEQVDKRVWECIHRIVWVEGRVHSGDHITPSDFETWAPHEEIPEGDRVPDGD